MQEKRLPREYIRRIWRAIYEFGLLQPNDRILIGLSGGKDSLFLLYAMAVLREHPPFPFELGAVTIDMGFPENGVDDFGASGGADTGADAGADADRQALIQICRDLDVPHIWVPTKIAEAALGISADNRITGKDPCARCSHFRRAVLAETAAKHGYQKLALGHHHDDAVETFLLSILYSGQIRTFTPKAHMDRSGITVIRPLSYLREHEIKKGVALTGFTPLASRCPLDCTSQRAVVKNLLHDLVHDNRFVYTNIAAAMRAGRPCELWPAALGAQEKRELNFGAWRYQPKQPDQDQIESAPVPDTAPVSTPDRKGGIKDHD